MAKLIVFFFKLLLSAIFSHGFLILLFSFAFAFNFDLSILNLHNFVWSGQNFSNKTNLCGKDKYCSKTSRPLRFFLSSFLSFPAKIVHWSWNSSRYKIYGLNFSFFFFLVAIRTEFSLARGFTRLKDKAKSLGSIQKEYISFKKNKIFVLIIYFINYTSQCLVQSDDVPQFVSYGVGQQELYPTSLIFCEDKTKALWHFIITLSLFN